MDLNELAKWLEKSTQERMRNDVEKRMAAAAAVRELSLILAHAHRRDSADCDACAFARGITESWIAVCKTQETNP